MKKAALKLIPALCMLLISAMMLGTTTYAWFSMNNTVTATGMQVTAQSDSLFVQIAGDADSGTFSTTGTSSLNATLYPVAHESWSTIADITDFDLNDDSTNDNWYFRYSDATNNATSNMTAKEYISSFTGYVATTTFDVKLNANSGQDTAYDLYVSDITIPATKGIKVVIVGADGYQEYSASASGITFNNGLVISDTVTKTQQTITVYIFFDGNDASVYSDNVAALTGSIDFRLTVFSTDHT